MTPLAAAASRLSERAATIMEFSAIAGHAGSHVSRHNTPRINRPAMLVSGTVLGGLVNGNT